MKIHQILTFFKEHIDILNSNKTPSQEDIVEIRLKKKGLFCPRCKVKMHSHGLGRKRKVLLYERCWISYHPLRYICPRCRKTLTVNPPFVSFRSRIAESCKEQIIDSLRCRVSINEVAN